MQRGGQPAGSSKSAGGSSSDGPMPEPPLTADGLWYHDNAYSTSQLAELAKGAAGPNARPPASYMEEMVARRRAQPAAVDAAYEQEAAEEAAAYEARLQGYKQGISLPPRQRRPQAGQAGADASSGDGSAGAAAAAGATAGGQRRGPAASCHIT